jgi:hypothetical protein
MKQQLSEIEYLYRPIYRPAHATRFTSDISWDYVEAPKLEPMIAVRRGLPLSRHNYGIIAMNRQLTSKEREEYGLELV